MKPEDWPATVALPGVISEGTLRAPDLISAFVDTLKYLRPTRAVELLLTYSGWVREPDGEEAGELLVALIDALQEAAPEGYYFGTPEGDGACFGFFEVEEEEPWDEPLDDELESNEVAAARGMIRLYEIIENADENPEALIDLDAADFRAAYIAAGEVLSARDLA